MKLNELFAGLFEARKNPEMNPKLSAYEVLNKYKDDPNAFIHFTKHMNDFTPSIATMPVKFGVLPKYKYHTPMGLYGYPLKEFWAQTMMGDTKDFTKIRKFATDRPYIIVFTWTGKQKYLPDMSAYSEADWESDYKKLLQLYPDGKNTIEYALQTTNIKGPIGKLWNATRVLTSEGGKSKNAGIEWNHLFRRLGYSGFNDTGKGAYSQFEYPQTVFFSKDAIKIMDIAVNKVYDDSYTKQLVGDRTQQEVATLNKLHRVLGELLVVDKTLTDLKEPLRIDNNKPPITLTNLIKLSVRTSTNNLTIVTVTNRNKAYQFDGVNQSFKNVIGSLVVDYYIIPVIEYSVKKMLESLSSKETPINFAISNVADKSRVASFNLDIAGTRGILGFEYDDTNKVIKIEQQGFGNKQIERVSLSKYELSLFGIGNITFHDIHNLVMPQIEKKIHSIYDSFSESDTSWVSRVKQALSFAVENINDNGWASEDEEDGEPWEEIKWNYTFDKSKNTLYIDKTEPTTDPIGHITVRGNDLLCYDSTNNLITSISDYKDLNDDDMMDEISEYVYYI
jgi:hypothetical protein